MPVPEPQVEEVSGYEEAAEQILPEPVQRSNPRIIPPVEDFPQIAQRQIAAQQGRIESIADHAKKKKGFFERIAAVGLGRKDDMPAVQQREPAMGSARQEPRAQAPAIKQPPLQHSDPALDDDQLEIPAFLRRQAN